MAKGKLLSPLATFHELVTLTSTPLARAREGSRVAVMERKIPLSSHFVSFPPRPLPSRSFDSSARPPAAARLCACQLVERRRGLSWLLSFRQKRKTRFSTPVSRS